MAVSPASTVTTTSTLTSTQRYAAGALLALALQQSQLQQSHLFGSFTINGDVDGAASDRSSSSSSCSSNSSGSDADSDSPLLWIHPSQGLLRPVFRFLNIDLKAWPGLEETAISSDPGHHIQAYLRIMAEEECGGSTEKDELNLSLAKAIDAMSLTLATVHISEGMTKERRSLQADVVVQYPQKVAILFELLSACVADSPQDYEKSLMQRKGYDARHRIALRLLASWLDVNWTKMEAMEIMVAFSAMAENKEQQKSQDSNLVKNKWAKWKRGGIIGAAALTGGALLAITGGLAAPAIAAGFGALAPTLGTLIPVIGAGGFAAVAGAAGSVVGSVAVAASFGAAGAGLSGSKMARRIGDVKEFEFLSVGANHNQGRLAVGILVSGFVFNESEFVTPWESYEDNLERYALQWESKHLIAVSTSIQDWLTSTLTRELMKGGAMLTVLSSLLTALAWPAALLSITDFIDSKWTIAIDRSDKAGKLLAETLIKGLQGNRPVTLLGFSLGARVIFKCLQYLAEIGDNEGLVERVVLLGAPIELKVEEWVAARKVVAGRFINVYSANDWILGVTFRASLLTQGLAGIQAVDLPGIENVDVTHIVEGHSSYLDTVSQILEQLQLEACNGDFLYAAQQPSD